MKESVVGEDGLDSQSVAVHAEACDNTEAGTGDEGVVTELLALMNIRDMHLDDGCLQ